MSTRLRQRWAEVSPLLDAALELDGAQRDTWLAAQVLDPELHALLVELLRQHGKEGEFDTLRKDLVMDPAALLSGRTIGDYEIQRRLGDGGMATVFLAKRSSASYEQWVALKLLRHGLLDELQLQLFRREQRILARLEHSGIARLIDAGVTDSGAPFLVTEYVDGSDITHYCDAQRLSVEQRLRLFLQVCEAVRYAHRNLVVHRDIKPSNILVSRDGGVKLLDFGIAKLLGDPTHQTEAAYRQLTPSYAAPEQFSGAAVSTATDVFALGVLLHELLTGVRPTLHGDGELVLPSLRAIQVKTDTTVARQSSPTGLRRRLRGDLDGILAQALRRDPALRYAGASDLAHDIERHLTGLPVQARPDSFAYRSYRFVRRHRGMVALGTALVLTLFAATGVSLYQAASVRASAAEARREAERANAVRAFLFSLFAAAEPGSSEPIQSAEGLLRAGARLAMEAFSADPAARVELLTQFGSLERQRGSLGEARKHLEDALKLGRRDLGLNDPRSLAAATSLAKLEQLEGRFLVGRDLLGDALAAYPASVPPVDTTRWRAEMQLAVLHARAGDSGRAVDLAQRLLGEIDSAQAADAELHSESLETLADTLIAAGRYKDALDVQRRALDEATLRYGADHAEVAGHLGLWADTLRQLGRLAEAEDALRRQVAIYRRVFDGPTPKLATALNDLGVTLDTLGKSAAAGELFEEALQTHRALHSGDHPEIATALGNLGVVRRVQGRLADSETMLREQLAMMQRIHGGDHPVLGRVRRQLGSTLIKRGQWPAAAEQLTLALAIDRRHKGEDSLAVAYDRMALGDLARARGDTADSIAEFETVMDIFRRQADPGFPARAMVALRLADAYASSDPQRSQKAYEEALDVSMAARPLSNETLLQALQGLLGAARLPGSNIDASELLARVRSVEGLDAKTMARIDAMVSSAHAEASRALAPTN